MSPFMACGCDLKIVAADDMTHSEECQSVGRAVGRTGEIGNCINLEIKEYERVFIEINENACYEQSVRIGFKRNSCGKPSRRLLTHE